MRPGLVVSAVAHLAVIAWGLWWLPKPATIDASNIEMIPVEFIEFDDITQMTVGLQTAALIEDVPEPPPPPEPEPPPLPRPAPPPEPEPPPAPEPEPPPPLPTQTPPPPPPEPAPPPPTPSPEAVAPPSEETRVAEPLTNVPAPRLRPERPNPPEPAPPPQPEQEAFDVDKLTAMLDQPEAQPEPPPAPVVQEPTLGTPTAPAGVTMTANEIDAFRSRLMRCWNVIGQPPDPPEFVARITIRLNSDGSLATAPQMIEAGSSSFARSAADSALRAVVRCAPYTLPPEKYETWKEITVSFRSDDM